MTNPNDQAHPYTEPPGYPGDTATINYGLTKREWFAGMALQGLLASRERTSGDTDFGTEACQAADAADTLINVLNDEVAS